MKRLLLSGLMGLVAAASLQATPDWVASTPSSVAATELDANMARASFASVTVTDTTSGLDSYRTGGAGVAKFLNGSIEQSIADSAIYAIGNNAVVTFAFGSAIDIWSVKVYTYWLDHGRQGFNILSVEVSEDGTTWRTIDNSSKDTDENGFDACAIDRTDGGVACGVLADGEGEDLAIAVKGLRINFGTVENNWIGLSEIEVAGCSHLYDSYLVTFLDMDGTTVLQQDMVARGTSATPPTPPEHAGFDFLDWLGDYSNITEETVVRARYLAFDAAVWSADAWSGANKPALSDKDLIGVAGVLLSFSDNPTAEHSYEANGRTDVACLGNDLLECDSSANGKAFFVGDNAKCLVEFPTAATVSALKLYSYHSDGGRDGIGIRSIWVRYSLEEDFVQLPDELAYSIGVLGVNDGRDAIAGNDGLGNSSPGAYRLALARRDGSPLAEDIVALRIDFGIMDNKGTYLDEIEVLGELAAADTFHVTFLGFSGEILKEQDVTPGEDAVPPAVAVPEGYVFMGWSDSYEKVARNLVLQAQFLPLYRVIFLDLDGTTELANVEVVSGTAAVAPDIPVHEGWTFLGWDTDFSKIEANQTIRSLWVEAGVPVWTTDAYDVSQNAPTKGDYDASKGNWMLPGTFVVVSNDTANVGEADGRRDITTLADGRFENAYVIVNNACIEYDLAEPANLKSIDLYSIWANGGRDAFEISGVSIRRQGEAEFQTVKRFQPGTTGGLGDNGSHGKMWAHLTCADGSFLGENVEAVRILFGNVDNGYIGLAEVAFTGIPTSTIIPMSAIGLDGRAWTGADDLVPVPEGYMNLRPFLSSTDIQYNKPDAVFSGMTDAGVLTDGNIPFSSVSAENTYGIGDDAEIVFDFARPVNLKAINLYSYWDDNGRNGTSITALYVREAGTSTYRRVWMDPVAYDDPSRAQVAILSAGEGLVAAGIDSIRIIFGKQDHNGTGYREIGFIGSKAPRRGLLLLVR